MFWKGKAIGTEKYSIRCCQGCGWDKELTTNRLRENLGGYETILHIDCGVCTVTRTYHRAAH